MNARQSLLNYAFAGDGQLKCFGVTGVSCILPTGSASEPAGDAKEGAASAKVKAIARKRTAKLGQPSNKVPETGPFVRRRMPPEGGDTKTKKGRGARQREKRRALASGEVKQAKASRFSQSREALKAAAAERSEDWACVSVDF